MFLYLYNSVYTNGEMAWISPFFIIRSELRTPCLCDDGVLYALAWPSLLKLMRQPSMTILRSFSVIGRT